MNFLFIKYFAQTVLSSAKLQLKITRSFIKMLNSRSPRIEPCRVPDLISCLSLKIKSTLTLYFLFDRQLEIKYRLVYYLYHGLRVLLRIGLRVGSRMLGKGPLETFQLSSCYQEKFDKIR